MSYITRISQLVRVILLSQMLITNISLINIDNTTTDKIEIRDSYLQVLGIFYSAMHRALEEKAFPQNADLCLSRFSSVWDINSRGSFFLHLFLSPRASPLQSSAEYSTNEQQRPCFMLHGYVKSSSSLLRLFHCFYYCPAPYQFVPYAPRAFRAYMHC